MAALNHLVQLVFHVVAEVVEAEFVVGAVGDVGGIGLRPLGVVEAVDDHADRQAEEIVDPAHVLGIAAGEIIVDGDDMDAVAGQRVEIAGEGGDERLAFAGLHLGDGALVQHHAADELDVEMALADGAAGGLAHGRERGNEQVVEARPGGELGAEFVGAGAQRLVGKRGDFGLERIDGRDLGPIGLQPAIVGAAKNLLREVPQHPNDLSARRPRAAIR